MANPFADYFTVKQAAEEIGAKARSTVTRLAYDEDGPRPDGKALAGKLIEGHGWMIQKKSVARYLEDQAKKGPRVGFPRGQSRKVAKPRSSTKSKATRKVSRA